MHHRIKRAQMPDDARSESAVPHQESKKMDKSGVLDSETYGQAAQEALA